MIRHAAAHERTQDLWLFHSNTTPEAAAFFDELQRLARTTPFLHFVPTMTDLPASKREWRGVTGLIDGEMLRNHLSIQGPRYYIAGPPAMVTGMRQMLAASGIADDDIRYEGFDGY